MATVKLDFEGLARALLDRSLDFVQDLLPGGKLEGREYKCADLRGGPGTSLSVNLETGQWADFATDHKGGDLISLLAAVENVSQGDAAKRAADRIGYRLRKDDFPPKPARSSPRPLPETPDPPKKRHEIEKNTPVLPPESAPMPSMEHRFHGRPSAHWTYRDRKGRVMFHVARYDVGDGKKEICPWSWCKEKRTWVTRGWPAPRPLYGLHKLTEMPSAPVLLVEGEKAAEAAQKLVGRIYAVMTWPNGSSGVTKVDWRPIHGRKVLIWPDADEPGEKAGGVIGRELSKHCPEVKIIQVDWQGGWDAADALREGWDWTHVKQWASSRVRIYGENSATVRQSALVKDHRGAQAAAQATASVEVNIVDDPQPTESNIIMWERLGLSLNKNNVPWCNVDNALRIIENNPRFKDLVWYDEFHMKYLTTWDSKKPREWQDIDDLNLAAYMQRELGIPKMSDEMVSKAVTIYAHQRIRNAPRDWMDTLEWDGTERIANFFEVCLGAGSSDYIEAASRNFWIGMAARIYRPGCQLDNMVVLEGHQGIGKTQALRAIGGDWYVEATESVQSKDFYMILRGRLLIEIAEMDSFSRTEVTKIKQVITCTTDSYRAPYDRRVKDHPRQCIFVGTTNEESYLRDNTGARRFWPVRCRQVDVDSIHRLRPQLFAEAVSRYNKKEHWHKMPDRATSLEQEARRQSDEWESIIEKHLESRDYTTMTEIWMEAFGADMSRLNRQEQMRIANCLRSLGWTRRDGRHDGKKAKYWIRLQDRPYTGVVGDVDA